MRQAILVKYLPPTNHKGSRIKASCAAASVIVPYQSEFSPDENYSRTAVYLLAKLGWDTMNTIRGGQLKNGDVVFVLVPRKGVQS